MSAFDHVFPMILFGMTQSFTIFKLLSHPQKNPPCGLRLGYQLAIYPATGFLAMGQALTKVYRNLSEAGHGSEGLAKGWEEIVNLSINQSIYLPRYLSILSMCRSICLSISPCIYLI